MSNEWCVRQLSKIFRNSGLPEENLKSGVQIRQEANSAVQLFTRYVVENKNTFIDDRNCYDYMVRTYLNILLYVEGEKTKIKYLLAQFDELDEDLRHEILKLSRNGRYVGITRVSLPNDEQFRRKLMNLIEDFNSNKTYGQLMQRLDTFAIKTQSSACASITGILSALRDEEFMVYNKRSACPMQGTECIDLVKEHMAKYRDFNDTYRDICKTTGWSLLELDTIANYVYGSYA